MCYCGGEAGTAGFFPGSRNLGRWMRNSFLRGGSAKVLFSTEVIILDSDIGRTPTFSRSWPSLLVWHHASSVFSSFPRCLENSISSPWLPPYPPWSCPASQKTTWMYSSYFPISHGVTLFSGMLKLQDSLLIIVFALSNLICQSHILLGKGSLLQATPLNGFPSYSYSLPPRVGFYPSGEIKRDVNCLNESSFSPDLLL